MERRKGEKGSKVERYARKWIKRRGYEGERGGDEIESDSTFLM